MEATIMIRARQTAELVVDVGTQMEEVRRATQSLMRVSQAMARQSNVNTPGVGDKMAEMTSGPLGRD